MIDLIIKTNGSERHLSLPIDEQFVPGITEKNSVTTVMVVNEPESLRYLVGKQWSVDELNFLAKRLESFDKLEDAQFNAAVSYLQPQSISNSRSTEKKSSTATTESSLMKASEYNSLRMMSR